MAYSGNKFKQRRAEKAHEGGSKQDKPSTEARGKALSGGGGASQGDGKSAGPRAQAHEVEQTDPVERGLKEGAEMEGGAAPHGASESGDMVAKEHGPAHEVHITHDQNTGEHHVFSVHQDGHRNHSMHATPEEAHLHASAAAGIPGGMKEKDEGEYPEGHHSATANGDPDDYTAEAL